MEPNKELPPVENSESLVQPSEKSEQLIVNPENTASITGSKQPKTASPAPVSLNQSTSVEMPQITTSSPSDDNMLIADDTDLIEKEWVNKAKQIVEHTKDDPHLQTNEMSKFKSQYQKKRYNKDSKVSSG